MSKNQRNSLYLGVTFFRNLLIIIAFFISMICRSQCALGLFATNQPINCLSSTTSATVTVVSGGTPPYTYTWLPTGGNASVAVGIPPGNYTVIARDAFGCKGSTNLVILNNTGVSVLMSSIPPNCSNTSDGSIIVTVTGSPPAPITYSWTPSAPNTATLNNLSAGAFSVLVTDGNGCTYSNSVAISSPPPIISSIATKTINCFGAMSGATVTASGGTGNLSYSWTPAAGTSSINNNIPAGNYTATVTDANGCIITNSITITQPNAFTASVIATNVSCNGLNNGQSAALVAGGTPAYSYTWLPSGSNAISISSLTPGSYTLLSKDSRSCTASYNFSITQPAPLTYTTAHTDEFCVNADGTATITVFGGTTPYTYSWSTTSAQTGSVATGLAAGTYSNFITDNNNCKVTAVVTVGNLSNMVPKILSSTNVTCNGSCNGGATAGISGGVGPFTYTWITVPSATNANVSGLCAGTFSVKITDSFGCYSYTTVTITEPPVLGYTITGANKVCAGNSSTLTANVSGGSAPYSYTWSPGGSTGSPIIVTPSNNTVYSLVVKDGGGCVGPTKTFTVSVNSPLGINLSAGSISVCPNANAVTSVSATGGDGNYSFSWFPGNVNTQSIVVNIASTTVYTVIITDGCGSTPVTNTVNVTVFPTQTPSFNSSFPQGCEPHCVQFTNTTPSVTSVYWAFGDFGASVISPVATHCYDRSGNYSINLITTDQRGCKSSIIVPNYVTVYATPKADFINEPEIIDLNDNEVLFTNASINASQLYWSIDGQSVSSKTSFTHSFFEEGCYDFKLIATNDALCSDTVGRQICVNIGFNFYAPDAFTPDGDTHNDIFKPKGTDWSTEGYSFIVVDRWGLTVFKTKDISGGWDGKYGGSLATDDVYVWLVHVVDFYGKEHSYEGRVMLAR